MIEDKRSDDKISFEKNMEASEGRLTDSRNEEDITRGVEPDKSGKSGPHLFLQLRPLNRQPSREQTIIIQ